MILSGVSELVVKPIVGSVHGAALAVLTALGLTRL